MPKRTSLPKGKPARSGGVPRRPLRSPWWDGVLSTLSSRADLVDTLVTGEKLAELIQELPQSNGRKVRPMAAVRRLAPMLELVERGPNGSRSRGATYRIVTPPPREALEMGSDDWLKAAIDKMCGKEKRR